jgi:hypothetical protein
MRTSRQSSAPTRRAMLAWWAATMGAFIAASLMIAAPAFAALPPQAFEAALQQFQQGSATGEARAIESAAEQFARLASAEPSDPVLLAYSGAATAMRAKTTLDAMHQMAFADDGLGRLDKALALLGPAHDGLLHRGVPASLETRFVAATTFLRLPPMMNRRGRGLRLLDEVLQSPLLAGAPTGFRAAVQATSDKVKAKDVKP